MDTTEIYNAAWNKWGDKQYIMLFEEMAELTKEISKHMRGKQNQTEIAEEIADVQIMLDQMKLRFGKKQVEYFMDSKLARLEKLIQE